MKRRKKVVLWAWFGLTIFWTLPARAQLGNIDAAKKEGKVVVYAAVPPKR